MGVLVFVLVLTIDQCRSKKYEHYFIDSNYWVDIFDPIRWVSRFL